jgi:endonuclease/exonuclease/phosphatase family metal-dependent hydrolase
MECNKPIQHNLYTNYSDCDETGKIVSEEWGGKRRIDRILVNHDNPACVTGFAFSTALAGLTDHIPVSLSLQVKNPLPPKPHGKFETAR